MKKHRTESKEWSAYFTYDADAGSLTWKHRPIDGFVSLRTYNSWIARFCGKEAGTINKGYKIVNVDGAFFMAHRIAWEMVNGPIPYGLYIDHADGNPLNNKISNLRLCTMSQNLMNIGAHKGNLSGLKGVGYDRKRNKWVSYIMKDGRQRYLGTFPCPTKAHFAYCAASKVLHGQFSRTSCA